MLSEIRTRLSSDRRRGGARRPPTREALYILVRDGGRLDGCLVTLDFPSSSGVAGDRFSLGVAELTGDGVEDLIAVDRLRRKTLAFEPL